MEVLYPTLKKNQWSESHINPNFFEELVYGRLCETRTRFRIGPVNNNRTAREFENEIVSATIAEFYFWATQKIVDERSPFFRISRESKFAFADYKYFGDLFVSYDENEIKELFGKYLQAFDPYNLELSDLTLWLGSFGCHTPLHYDTYSTNIVLQVHGEKRWLIYPPNRSQSRCDDLSVTSSLPEIRIPYEESSVYSTYDPMQFNNKDADILNRDYIAPYLDVVLTPGDILFIPKHWWHFVETVIDKISI